MSKFRMTLDVLKTKKIAILGLGINNQKLAEYFRKHKIRFEIFDGWTGPSELTGKIDNFDIVFRTPGLPFLSEPIQQAKQKGVIIYSQTKIFFDLCPAKIIGVTGTKGKGTTATLISKILQEAGWQAWLAGNIGQDPFEFLEKIKPGEWVVLELSSFQLQDLERSPDIAVVLKITPEHLDHHARAQEYFAAKKPLVAYQQPGDFAVLNYDCEVTRNFALLTDAKIFWNSISTVVKPGAFVQGDKVFLNRGKKNEEIISAQEVKLLGRFNLENVTAAIAAVAAAGLADTSIMRRAIAAFPGLPHRLELVREVKGVKFYNDSFSTTPETALAALSAFSQPVVLIVGGSEKKSDYLKLGRGIAESMVKALLPIGTTGPLIAKLARARGYQGRIIEKKFEDMKQIVGEANLLAEPGDAVLLSPASASFDMFTNYKHRGELFRKFVSRL